MIGWNGRSYGDKSKKSLDFICKSLGLPGKTNLSGDKVWDYVKEDRYQEITEYCIEDVLNTLELYKRLNFNF